MDGQLCPNDCYTTFHNDYQMANNASQVTGAMFRQNNAWFGNFKQKKRQKYIWKIEKEKPKRKTNQRKLINRTLNG